MLSFLIISLLGDTIETMLEKKGVVITDEIHSKIMDISKCVVMCALTGKKKENISNFFYDAYDLKGWRNKAMTSAILEFENGLKTTDNLLGYIQNAIGKLMAGAKFVGILS